MNMYFQWASQTLLKNSMHTQPYGTCLCYKVCVQVQGASDCTHGVGQCMRCWQQQHPGCGTERRTWHSRPPA
jgi:hypothetical protein